MKHLKLGLILFLGLLKPVYGALQSERYFNNTGGLIDRYSPIIVPSKNASDIQNIQFDTRGQLLKRNGYTQNNTTDLTASAVTGGGYHQSTTGTSFLAVIVGTNVYTTGNTYGGSYTTVTGTTTITNSASNQAQFTSFQDWGVFCNESDPPFRVKSASGFRIVGASTGAKTCESFNNYLLLGNTSEDGTTYGSRLRWSDLGDLNTWPANNYIDIEPDDGDSIVAIKRSQQNLYIFKKKSIYEAVITGGSGADAFIVRPIARNIGAWSKLSVKAIESKGVVFLGADGVYLFDGTNFDFISDQIQTKINGLNRSRYSRAVGTVYPAKHQYWLSLSNATDTTNQTILVWDYIQESWTLYSGISANMLTTAEDSTGNIVLFSGDYGGKIYKQDTGTSDSPAGVTTAISSFYATPELTMGAPEVTKTYKYLYLFSKVAEETNITLDRAYDFNDSYQDSSSIAVGELGAVWDTAVWDSSLWPGTATKVNRIDLNRQAKSLRLKFSNSSSTDLGILGWVVVYTMDDYKE